MTPELQAAGEQFIASLLTGVLPVLASVLTALLILVLKRADSFLRAKLNDEHEKYFDATVRWVVSAAEQSGLSGEIVNLGKNKKAHAVTLVQEALRAAGLNTLADNTVLISNRIEAAVLEQINSPTIFTALEGVAEVSSDAVKSPVPALS